MSMRTFLFALSSAVVACGTSTSNGAGTGGSTTETSICASDPRAMAYAAGFSQSSADGALKASFSTAVPAPPAKGENAWTLTLADAHGAPLSNAAISVKPFMPDHGHGAPVVPTVTPQAAGSYSIANLDLFMPGIWTVTLIVTPASGPAESVVFSFCIGG